MEKDLKWKTYLKEIESLSALDYNYDEKVYHDSKDKQGWYIDHYEAILGKEAPGLPIPDGPFDRAKKAIQFYQFTDPRLISAVFDPDADLVGRNMLMFAKFAGFSFQFGVRIVGIVDEQRKNTSNQQLQVWGYSYRTLKGHFEIGEIRFEISKNIETGEIGFEINAYSKPDRIPNIFYRVGFKLFSRPLQKYFAKSSIERLQKIASA